MSLTTLSKFYFGHTVTADNRAINFKEGAGPELTAQLRHGNYSATEYAAEIKRALDVAGALTYTVTFTRSTAKITISTTSTFSLLVSTGSQAAISAFSMMGFTGSDRTGASTYTGNAVSGTVYTPQFILQDHKDSTKVKKLVDPAVLTSASGKVEVVKFGTNNFIQFSIKYATNLPQPSVGPITNNYSGVSELEAFLDYAITKGKIEYMPNKDSTSTFQTILLESNEESQNGTSYDLKEKYDRGLPGYFDTSIMKFRIID